MGDKVSYMGKSDIGKFNRCDENIAPDVKALALRRTMLIKSLNTRQVYYL